MKLFFGNITDGVVTIADEEQQHLSKVLRMRSGDEIYVTDGEGTLARGDIRLEGKKVLLDTKEIQRKLPPFSRRLHIAIAPTKNIDRIEFFVEKATEMGVMEITLLQTEKTERKNVNIEKLRKQVIAASKQSLRTHFPIVNDLTRFSEFIKITDPKETFVAHCHEDLERTALNNILVAENITFLIGPEGDFSEKEIGLLAEQRILAVSLGTQRLRTETAGVFIAAWNYMMF